MQDHGASWFMEPFFFLFILFELEVEPDFPLVLDMFTDSDWLELELFEKISLGVGKVIIIPPILDVNVKQE